MKTTRQAVFAQGTTGSLTARVQNPQVVPPIDDYVGDPDKMIMLKLGGDFRIHSTERFGSGPNQAVGFDFYALETLVPANGVEQVLSIPSQVRATWWAHENSGGQPYRGVSGELRITLTANARASGTFHFVGQAGTHQVQVTSGTFDLQGFTTSQSVRQHAPAEGTGSFNGTFAGGPAIPQFNAKQVSVVRFDIPGVPAYYDVQGRVVEAFPQRDTFISILVDAGAAPHTFDLATSTEASVSFFDFPDYGFAYAIAGTLTFTSKPDAGRATGTLNCTFRKNNEPTFTFSGAFDIVA